MDASSSILLFNSGQAHGESSKRLGIAQPAEQSLPTGDGKVHGAQNWWSQLINTGFGDRIMFGSDTRPAAPILRRLENIAWLTEKQRRAILYDNAARFLRLDAQTIARHHAR